MTRTLPPITTSPELAAKASGSDDLVNWSSCESRFLHVGFAGSAAASLLAGAPQATLDSVTSNRNRTKEPSQRPAERVNRRSTTGSRANENVTAAPRPPFLTTTEGYSRAAHRL